MAERLALPPLPVWKHWPQQRLLREKRENPRSFARGFEMKAFSDDERKFPSFKSCYSPGVKLVDIVKLGWPTFIGVDLAGTKRPGTVLFAASIEPVTMRRFPVEVQRGNWTSPETAKRLAQMHDRHNTRYVMVENNGYQQAIIDWIRSSNEVQSDFYYKVEAFTTGGNKVDPEVGLPSLEIEFKNRGWVIPVDEYKGHPPACKCGWCVWDSEMVDYPFSAQTDTVMASWFCREGMAAWGGGRGNAVSGLSDINVR